MSPAEPLRQITLDQVVAYNLKRARQLRGWTQAQAAEEIEPYLGELWSVAVFSAAERSVESSRVRTFSASQVLAFALGFRLPIAWFYMPPTLDVRVGGRDVEQSISGEALLHLLFWLPKSQQASAMDDRLSELAPGDTQRLRPDNSPTAAQIEQVSQQLDQFFSILGGSKNVEQFLEAIQKIDFSQMSQPREDES